MKTTTISTLAFVASVQAAGWQDAPADPVKSTTTTKPVELTSTWSDVDIVSSTTTTDPVKETTQSYWGDEEVVKTTTTTGYPSKDTDKPVEGGEGHTWSDEPVLETTTTVVEEHTWSDYVDPTPSPEKPVLGGEGDADHTWSDAEVPAEKTTTVTATGTLTETKWVDVSPTDPASPEEHTWEDAPATPTDVSPAEEPSTWLDWASTAVGSDECVVTVITKYGKPTWTPDSGAEQTWVDAAIPETTPVAGETPATWVDAEVPASSTPATWVDAEVPASSTPATWVDAPAPTDPVSGGEDKPWEDVPSGGECSESTVTEEVTITYTVTAEHTWADVPAVPTDPVSDDEEADHTWADIPAEPTEPVSDDEAEHTWADVPADPTKPADDKPVHGGHGKPTTTTTTTPAVETETKTWADYTISTTEPSKETTTTWSKPTKPTTTTEDKPTKPTGDKPTKPTEDDPSEETKQAYWGDAQ